MINSKTFILDKPHLSLLKDSILTQMVEILRDILNLLTDLLIIKELRSGPILMIKEALNLQEINNTIEITMIGFKNMTGEEILNHNLKEILNPIFLEETSNQTTIECQR